MMINWVRGEGHVTEVRPMRLGSGTFLGPMSPETLVKTKEPIHSSINLGRLPEGGTLGFLMTEEK